MASTAITFGTLLILLGVVGYVATGAVSITALIPAFFGFALVVLGAVAREESRRKHAMHAAAAVGLIGFLGSVRGLTKLPSLVIGDFVTRPAAIVSQSIMALLMLVFVALCVKSFIAARRSRAS